MNKKHLTLDFLLELHDQHADRTALNLNLCDGYLYSTNPTYKNNRDCGLALGCQYTFEDTFHYGSNWLISLPELLKLRSVPYRDNVSRLREVVRLRPNRFLIDESLLTCQNNYVFHEPCHIICDAVLDKKFFEKIKFKDADQKEMVRLNLQEAFALTQESLGHTYTQTSLDKALWSFTTNGWTPWIASPNQMFEPIIDLVDYRGAHKIAMMFFLTASLHYQGLDRATYHKILGVLFPDLKAKAKDLERFQILFKHAARYFTSVVLNSQNVFFRFLFEKERTVFDLCGFNFIQVFEKNPELLERLDVLAELSQFGTSAPSAKKFMHKKAPSIKAQVGPAYKKAG